MTDGGERVADFVRDVGGEPAERRQLELLRLLPGSRRVLDEQHARAIGGARVKEPQADVAAAHREIRRRARGHGTGAPAAPALGELGQQRLDVGADQRLGAQQELRLRVVLQHATGAVEHQHAVVHVSQHELVDARLRGEAPLVLRHAAREPAGDAARHEAAEREEARLHVAVARRIVREHPVGLLQQERDGGERGIEVRQAPRRDDRRADERDHQHHAQAAPHAAARAHQEHDGDDVGAGVQRQLHVEQLARAAQEHLERDGEAEVGAAGEAEQLQRMRAEVERVLIDEGQREEQDRHRDAVEVEVAQRDPEGLRRALARCEEQLRIAKRCLHQRFPLIGPSRACSSEQ